MIRTILASLAAYAASLLSLQFSAPIWVLLVPVLLLERHRVARAAGLAVLGGCVDIASGHPLLLVVVLPLLGAGMSRLERLVDRNPLFLGTVAFVTTLGILALLVVSRLFAAGAAGLPASLPALLRTTFSPALLAALLTAAAAAVLFERLAGERTDERVLIYE